MKSEPKKPGRPPTNHSRRTFRLLPQEWAEFDALPGDTQAAKLRQAIKDSRAAHHPPHFQISSSNAMKDQELSKRLAELLGWEINHHDGRTWVPPGSRHPRKGVYCTQKPPDYATDLNAVHDTVQGLDREIRKRYRETLALRHGELAVDATARQRTEALIKTLEEAP